MGKVGSKSVEATLSHFVPNQVIHAHFPSMIGKYDWKHIQLRKLLRRPIIVITPIREPITRNLSAFFTNFEMVTGARFISKSWNIEEVRNIFLQKYDNNKAIHWFDKHLKPLTGIDVFAEEFPKDIKWKTYKRGNIRVLVYRLDLEKEKQLEIISDFVGYKITEWKIENVGENRTYGDFYKQFCNEINLPSEYLEFIQSQKLAKHFWTDEENQKVKQRWLAK